MNKSNFLKILKTVTRHQAKKKNVPCRCADCCNGKLAVHQKPQ